jgi:tetraacyldisaccharide 4'-kinase
LARDVEVAVLDRRGLMNGWQLPAGPLREPVSRLKRVDALVLNGLAATPLGGVPVFAMQLVGTLFQRLGMPEQTCSAADLAGLRLHAVAGIGEPARFFDHLQGLGLSFDAHPFPDHHAYCAEELAFDGDAILTTEKDAVKFPASMPLPVWVLPVEARVDAALARLVLEKINGCTPA